MILTITYRGDNAADLGYLLHKNPNRPQTIELNYGKAHVFYSDARDDECTAVLLLDINPVDLARGKKGSEGSGLFDYVNDRPYAASSFMSVAMARAFGTAMTGRSKERQELAEKELDFRVRMISLPSTGGRDVILRLFEPLGYKVELQEFMLDEKFPGWGKSRYYNVDLDVKCRLRDMLNHLYVLIPVMDNEKHYWVGVDEVDKLLKHGEGWLSVHPERNMITARYFNRRKSLISMAFKRLMEDEPEREEVENEAKEPKLNLNQQRMGTVLSVLKGAGAKTVIDIGCGEGVLLSMLLKDRDFEKITGVDVSYSALERAKDRLKLDRMPESQRKRIELFQGSLTYRDKRFSGYDAAAVIEVIEHLDENRLAAFERVLFKFARPNTVVVTTPNIEYNKNYKSLHQDSLRHKDHRFEWTRSEFESWALKVAEGFGYNVRFIHIGEFDSESGAPTQMGVFTL